ncbi:hypothetical protein [Solibacillus ferritrahens]|uniref:hypothetical protein n=1 Tax=Solibacillus ferritrahens TaxID=3098620 RepID=UPI0030086D59
MKIIWTILLCITLISLLLFFPEITHEGADIGINLFMEALFPYLLPYLVLTNWLLKLTHSHKNVSFLVFIQTYGISAIGGYPTGAATITQLVKRNSITKKQAAYLLGICHCPSPLFLFGFVGSDLLNSSTLSWQYLILLHSFSFILLIIVYLNVPTLSNEVHRVPKDPTPFTTSIRESAPTILIVATTIIFFTTIYHVFLHSVEVVFDSIPTYLELAIASFLEMTNGLFLLHQNLYGDMLLFFTVVLLTTQSLSIHLQVIVIARTANIAIRPYIMIRVLYSIIIPLLFALFFL